MRDWPDTRVERTRAVGDPPGEAWRRRRDHAAIVDRARGYARQAQRHDAAREGMRLTEHAQARQWREHGTSSPYPHDLVVWPEPAGGDR